MRRREGSEVAWALGQVSKQAWKKQGLLYTVAQYVHCMKHPGRGGVRLKWNPHSTHQTAFLARVYICLEEKASLTEAREEWFRELDKARPTLKHIKKMTDKPREGQVLNTTGVWVVKGWWLGAMDKLRPWELLADEQRHLTVLTPYPARLCDPPLSSLLHQPQSNPATPWRHSSTPEILSISWKNVPHNTCPCNKIK